MPAVGMAVRKAVADTVAGIAVVAVAAYRFVAVVAAAVGVQPAAVVVVAVPHPREYRTKYRTSRPRPLASRIWYNMP